MEQKKETASPRISDTEINIKDLSTHTKKEILQHRTELKDKKYNNTWDSCCFKIDKRMVEYITQTGIATGLVCYCSYQISYSDDCERSNPYWSLLGSIIGFIFKSAIKRD